MSESLQAEIAAKKEELVELQGNSKRVEREGQVRRDALAAEKAELLEGVKARMELIDMLKRDIVRMAAEETIRIAQQEYDNPSSAPKK